MIGIDITRISRFSSMHTSRLLRLAEEFNTNFQSGLEAAKWWACHEAVIKCLGVTPDWKISKITFPNNSAPLYTGPENISLSLSHEGDHVVAVALRSSP